MLYIISDKKLKMGDEDWVLFPKVTWVSSYWGETNKVTNPIADEASSIRKVIAKTKELIGENLVNDTNDLQTALISSDFTFGSQRYKDVLAEQEVELVEKTVVIV